MINKYEEFCKEYKEIVEKYGLYVGACGCCNSPYIKQIQHWLTVEDIIKHLLHPKSNMHSG